MRDALERIANLDITLDAPMGDEERLKLACRIAREALASEGEAKPTQLEALAHEIRHVNLTNGWRVPCPEDWDDPNRIPTFLCLIHSEVSEALEGFRVGDRANVAEELADTFIRVLDLAHGLGIDLTTEVFEKLEKNRNRGIRHGGKKQI